MKLHLPLIAVALATPLLSAGHVQAGESQNAKTTKDNREALPTTVIVREEFGSFFGIPYSQTLGLALWHKGHLYDSHVDSDIAVPKDKASQDLQNKMNKKLAEIARGAGGTLITDYSKLGLGKMLSFENDEGSAVLLRVREKFQMLNEDVGDATYTYVDDRKLEDSGSRVQAAVMLDIYIDWLYNRQAFQPLDVIKQPYRFWMRAGFEISKNDLPGAQEVDQQSYFGLLNFQANPDQNARFMFIPGLEVTSPQIVQLGGVFERNELTGEEGGHWIAGWTPIFHLLEDHGIFKRGFGLNKRMFFGGAPAEQKITAKKKTTTEFSKKENVNVEHLDRAERVYLSINPHVDVVGASDVRGVLKELGKTRSVKDLQKLRDEQVQWKLEVILGYSDGLVQASYLVEGSHPIGDLGKSRIGQEARLDVDLGRMWNPKPEDWHNLKGYVSYKRGQFDPTYVDVETITAGVSLKF